MQEKRLHQISGTWYCTKTLPDLQATAGTVGKCNSLLILSID